MSLGLVTEGGGFGFGIWDFEFVSNFGFRISDFDFKEEDHR